VKPYTQQSIGFIERILKLLN